MKYHGIVGLLYPSLLLTQNDAKSQNKDLCIFIYAHMSFYGHKYSAFRVFIVVFANWGFWEVFFHIVEEESAHGNPREAGYCQELD